MKTIKILLYILIFSFTSFVRGQEIPLTLRQIHVDMNNLCDYSKSYDKYLQLTSDKYTEDRVKYGKLYKDLVYKIKHGSNRSKYLKFLDKSIGKDSLLYRDNLGFSYIYENPLLPIRPRDMPTRLEFFKVVKYSLFTMDKEELLPPKDVPFLKYKAR